MSDKNQFNNKTKNMINHKNINSTSYHQLTFALKFLMPEAAAPPPHGNTGRQRNENLRGKMR